ncbi:hypothetical protein N7520_004021 [Penicillium odoratum]|uniref:uncharacterized protein n=1 Tax=Penicillium odoratum TaxID=1167516 RepID=UPI0025484B65|nr:uncharacterized protein N7520_004021 [Penicillium odoratum]KAJ5769462.1 hypothetical protein N7520_004021 [Penicillium odoratum]
MPHPVTPRGRKDFSVAIICALEVESDAVELLFDHIWDANGDRYGKAHDDTNSYRTGAIGNHNVVLAYMTGMGKVQAATVAKSCRSSFPCIRIALIVGICGGVPGSIEGGMFLGDIIISDEILPYDFGKRFPGTFKYRETASCSTVSSEVQAFLRKLRSPKGREHLISRTEHHLDALRTRSSDYSRPSRQTDLLFEPNYHHKHHETSQCKTCGKPKSCKKAQKATCKDLKCDVEKLVVRSRSSQRKFSIHFGRIASGDTVMKSGMDRDRIADKEKVIAFEMEGAGIAGIMPFIVIKGVCDYADSHKNKIWQKHAAGAAASCMKSMLEQWAVMDQFEETHQQPSGSSQESKCSIKETSSEVCALPTRNNEGYHSKHNPDASNEELLRVLPELDSCFKCVIKSFREHRKYLPRDADLKEILKNQRFIVSDHAKVLLSNGSISSSRVSCLEIALGIQKKLEIIEDLVRQIRVTTQTRSQPISALSSLKVSDIPCKHRSNPQANKSYIQNSVEDLESLIQNFTSAMSQPMKIYDWRESTITRAPKRRRKFEDFRVVQQAARSLYEAVGTACAAHTVHTVHISLQPALDGTTTRVRFNVAFFQHKKAPENTVWIDVESTIKSHESYSQLEFTSSSGESHSLKRQRETERGNCSSAQRKRVQFKFPVAPIQSLCPKTDAVEIPNLHIQRNFCKVVERFLNQQEPDSCIGLLGDNRTCKHLAYVASRTSVTTSAMSLSELISQPRSDITMEMSQYERVRLAKYLATAVLYYHATPWLNKGWRSEDVHLINSSDPFIEQPQHILAYMTSSVSTEFQPVCPGYHRFVRNPVLFGLGVMLLELAFQAPLSSLERSTELQGEESDFIEYFTACRVVEFSHAKISKSFKDVIKRCLYCDFGHDNDFTSPALQQAFYNNVITVLEDLEERFRELQLD